jgi:hypothetical protein
MANWIAVVHGNDPTHMLDRSLTLQCPHCNTQANLTPVSFPRYEQLLRYQTKKVIIGYRCDSCNEPIAIRFSVVGDYGRKCAQLTSEYEELERPMQTFDYQYLPEKVASDFREALICYSHSCLNASAAMCRRTIQSTAQDLGSAGSEKVQRQILDIKEAAGVDDETYEALKQVMLGGHDGSHPHLPSISPERLAVMIELMRDVLYQLYIRKAKVQEAAKLRKDAITSTKS